MFSDTEIGLVLAHDRELRAHTAQAQGLLHSKNDEIALLRGALAAARRDLGLERAERLALEFELARLNKLLDTPLN
jgi:hypothetical protein